MPKIETPPFTSQIVKALIEHDKFDKEPGVEAGEVCNRDGCKGIIEEGI